MNKLIINRNETLYGPSPKAMRIIKNFRPERAALYLEGYYNSTLIPYLSKRFNLLEEQIIVSYGEEDFFRMVFDKLDSKNDSVLTHELHYSYYDKYLNFKNIKIHLFKMNEIDNEFDFDISDCIEKYPALNPKILLITSPNNPTGNSISASSLDKILNSISPSCLVILDEAYWGFDKNYNQREFLSLINKYQNLVALRSFSKLYALAGLRISYALCGKNVKNILNYQTRYLGMSRVLEEVAIAALESKTYYKKLSEEIMKDREWFIEKAKGLKYFKPFRSNANFVLVRINKKRAPAAHLLSAL